MTETPLEALIAAADKLAEASRPAGNILFNLKQKRPGDPWIARDAGSCREVQEALDRAAVAYERARAALPREEG